MFAFTLIFRTLMGRKAFLSTWCRTFMHTREKEVFFPDALKKSHAPTPQEEPFQVMFSGTQRTEEQEELNTCELQSQDATKITSAFADSRIQFPWSVMSVLARMLCLCMVLMNLLLCVAHPSPNFVTIARY